MKRQQLHVSEKQYKIFRSDLTRITLMQNKLLYKFSLKSNSKPMVTCLQRANNKLLSSIRYLLVFIHENNAMIQIYFNSDENHYNKI